MTPTLLSIAFLLDLMLGDPRSWPHPVVGLGRTIGWISARLLKHPHNPLFLKVTGLVMALGLTGCVWGLGRWAIGLAARIGPGWGPALAVYLAFTTLALRGLYDQTWRIVFPVLENDLERARKMLSMVVGRETAHLDRPGILRAIIETVAENLSDGVIAPLFYLALGGPPLALAYKAVNTLDSMVGYKHEPFRHLGWASARLDDAANYVPARLTALLIVVASALLRLPAARAYSTWRRDCRRHSSPNAGHTEAAMAGALGVQLGGPSKYAGQWVEKPVIGKPLQALSIRQVLMAERILVLSGLLMLLMTMAVKWLI